MEQEEKSKSTGKNSGIKNLKPWKKGDPSPNPKGKAKGQRDYATIYREALIKLAKASDTTAEDLEIQILQKGLSLARKGDYKFYKDTLDRTHGTPIQKTEVVLNSGKSLATPEMLELEDEYNQKLKALILKNGTPEDKT